MYYVNPANDNFITLYVTDLEQQEAQANLRMYLEGGMGTLISLGNSPTITMNGGKITRIITSYSAVYRKGDTVQYCSYEGSTRISATQNEWNLLLINGFTIPQLYLLDGNELMFFPQENMSASTADFVEIYYKTISYEGIIRLNYFNGKQIVFSEAMTNHYGAIYGGIINEMASLAIDIHALETINTLQLQGNTQEVEYTYEPEGVLGLW